MKTKLYEKTFGMIILIITMWLIEGIIIIVLLNIKIIEYKQLPAMVIDKNTLLVYTKKNEKRLIYQNASFYLDDKKIKYIIKENDNLTFKLQTSLPKSKKQNDIITITIKEKRINMIDAIIQIWGGDKNNKS